MYGHSCDTIDRLCEFRFNIVFELRLYIHLAALPLSVLFVFLEWILTPKNLESEIPF